MICFHTDGQENSSTEHTWDELNALIKEKSRAGSQFNFMGVGIDAYHHRTRMGIPPQATVAYDHRDAEATRMAFGASAENARRLPARKRPTRAMRLRRRRRPGTGSSTTWSRRRSVC